MKLRKLHSWKLSARKAAALQSRLRSELRLEPYHGWPRTIAGADLSFHPPRGRSATAWGCVLLYRVEGRAGGRLKLREVERVWAWGRLAFPYVPGLLSFREAPVLLKAFRKLTIRPDVVFFDAQGTAHPRGLGEACHLGLWLDLPSIGVAKSLLVGEHETPGRRSGSWCPLKFQGRVVGAALRTRDRTRPVYVSPGHRMDLPSALRLAMACCDGTRLPLPTREADRFSKELRRAQSG